ncbi:MAG: prepilin-type N-terminal cleavage/methylation domain-containing protein [Thermoguttaceae bacterium]
MKRNAFTLLELILVLALITVVAAMGVGTYQRQHARSLFKSGVVELQIDLNRTRLLAMRSGQAYFFRFIPGTGIYEIAPLRTLQESIYRANGDVSDLYSDALGGSLSSSSFDDASSYSYDDLGVSDPLGMGGNVASDDLFSQENIEADLAEAETALRVDSSYLSGLDNTLGGTLSGDSYSGLSTSTLSSGGSEFALGSQLDALQNMGTIPTTTIREMNTAEKQIGGTDNTIAWRVNKDGLVVRKEAKGGALFRYARLSESTPTQLRANRPGSASSTADSSNDLAIDAGEDMGSRLGGSLRSVPTASSSTSLGGGLTAQTSGIGLSGDALDEGETSPVVSSVWSEPILFFPNGRTSTVVLALANIGKYSYYSEIGLRGMTGYARISSITSTPTGMTAGDSVLTQEQYFRLTNPGVETSAEGYGNVALGGNGAASGLPDASTTESQSGVEESANLLGDSLTSDSTFAPSYGSTSRRSGYRFDATSTSNDPLGTATSGVSGDVFDDAFNSVDAADNSANSLGEDWNDQR